MEESRPRLEESNNPEGRAVVVHGRWIAAQFTTKAEWRTLESSIAKMPVDAAWDLKGIEQLDHLGAQILWNHWGRKWPAKVDTQPSQRAVIDRVAQYTKDSPQRKKTTFSDRLDEIGGGVLKIWDHAKALVRLIGQLALDIGRLIREPHEGPWRDVSGHLYHIGATAMPITALVGFLIGVVLAYLTSQQLRQFGADAFIVNILGISLVRELGPVLAAILIAGRSGSAITAQIGVMRVTEELDAMRVMGIPHGFRLVMPRAIALAVAMPLISVWTTISALVGGMLAADLAMGITPTYFINALPDAVSSANLTLAIGKSGVFGILIALVGCHFGMRVEPNTESLGKGTTASVVTSITVVILVDALFAVIFKNIGI